MDYGKLLTRAFEITRTYRALWLFGVLLALFGGEGGGNFNFGNFGGGDGRPGTSPIPQVPEVTQQMILTIVLVLLCLALVWIILSIVLRFVSRAALIGLVQELEANGTTPTVGRGFSIGASRFWQLLGIALTINIPLAIFSLALILIAAAPMLAALIPMIQSGRDPEQMVGVFVSGILGSLLMICCVVLLLIAISLIIRPFYEFFVRECVIQKRGVFDSIREGYRIVRANLGNVALLYGIAIGIGIGWGVLMFVVALVALAIVALPAIAAGAAADSIGVSIAVGVVIGIPLLILLLFINGLYRAFESTYWTEGYLAITAPKPATAA
jgi:hypothetical protein